MIQNIEKLMAAMKKYSTPEKPVSQFVEIYDLEGFNFRDIMNRKGQGNTWAHLFGIDYDNYLIQ